MFLGPPVSTSGFVRQRYGSEDPDPHPDPYQNVTSPLHHHKECIKKSSGSNINKYYKGPQAVRYFSLRPLKKVLNSVADPDPHPDSVGFVCFWASRIR
jgi:hypothetical protein